MIFIFFLYPNTRAYNQLIFFFLKMLYNVVICFNKNRSLSDKNITYHKNNDTKKKWREETSQGPRR